MRVFFSYAKNRSLKILRTALWRQSRFHRRCNNRFDCLFDEKKKKLFTIFGKCFGFPICFYYIYAALNCANNFDEKKPSEWCQVYQGHYKGCKIKK